MEVSQKLQTNYARARQVGLKGQLLDREHLLAMQVRNPEQKEVLEELKETVLAEELVFGLRMIRDKPVPLVRLFGHHRTEVRDHGV